MDADKNSAESNSDQKAPTNLSQSADANMSDSTKATTSIQTNNNQETIITIPEISNTTVDTKNKISVSTEAAASPTVIVTNLASGTTDFCYIIRHDDSSSTLQSDQSECVDLKAVAEAVEAEKSGQDATKLDGILNSQAGQAITTANVQIEHNGLTDGNAVKNFPKLPEKISAENTTVSESATVTAAATVSIATTPRVAVPPIAPKPPTTTLPPIIITATPPNDTAPSLTAREAILAALELAAAPLFRDEIPTIVIPGAAAMVGTTPITTTTRAGIKSNAANAASNRAPTPSGSVRSIGSLVCRICHNSENPERLVSPCLCKGSLTYVHINCLERWISTSRSTVCELCQFQYNTEQTLRYSCLQSLRLWYSRSMSRRALQEDCQMFSLLTLVAFGIIGTLLVGIQYYFLQGRNWGLSRIWTKGWLIFFLLTTLTIYLINIYMIVKSQLSPWYRWWQSARDIKLILENRKPFDLRQVPRLQNSQPTQETTFINQDQGVAAAPSAQPRAPTQPPPPALMPAAASAPLPSTAALEASTSSGYAATTPTSPQVSVTINNNAEKPSEVAEVNSSYKVSPTAANPVQSAATETAATVKITLDSAIANFRDC